MTDERGTERLRRAAVGGRAEGLAERERLRALYAFQPDAARSVKVLFHDGPTRLAEPDGYVFRRTAFFVDDRGDQVEVVDGPWWSEDWDGVELSHPDGDPFVAEIVALNSVDPKATVSVEADVVLDGRTVAAAATASVYKPPGEAVGGEVTIASEEFVDDGRDLQGAAGRAHVQEAAVRPPGRLPRHPSEHEPTQSQRSPQPEEEPEDG